MITEARVIMLISTRTERRNLRCTKSRNPSGSHLTKDGACRTSVRVQHITWTRFQKHWSATTLRFRVSWPSYLHTASPRCRLWSDMLSLYTHRLCGAPTGVMRSFHQAKTIFWNTYRTASHARTPVSWVLLEPLILPQLVKKFHTFDKSRTFITAFTKSRHMFLSSARSIQPMSSHNISSKIHFNIILPSTGFKTDLIHSSCE